MQIYNKYTHYLFTGILSRFRSSTDPKITKDELLSALFRIKFPREECFLIRNGERVTVGCYSKDAVEYALKNKRLEIVDAIRDRRKLDCGEIKSWFDKRNTRSSDPNKKSMIQIEAECRKKKEEERRRFEEKYWKEYEMDMRNPEEDMEAMSDELLRNDDVYFDNRWRIEN